MTLRGTDVVTRSATSRSTGWRVFAGGCVLLVAAATPGGATPADQPPTVDARGLCEMEWAARLPDPRVSACIAGEERALRYLRVIYSAVSPAAREACERASRAATRGFGSHAFVKTCIDGQPHR